MALRTARRPDPFDDFTFSRAQDRDADRERPRSYLEIQRDHDEARRAEQVDDVDAMPARFGGWR